MLERGIVVCLGTDSLASTPSLSILDEMRFLHRADPSLNGALLLTMATLFGAWALRADNVTGSLRPGKSADLAVVALPDRDEADPYRLLLDSDLPVVASTFEGRFVSGPLGRGLSRRCRHHTLGGSPVSPGRGQLPTAGGGAAVAAGSGTGDGGATVVVVLPQGDVVEGRAVHVVPQQ